MFGKRQHKIQIDHELYERLEKAAQAVEVAKLARRPLLNTATE